MPRWLDYTVPGSYPTLPHGWFTLYAFGYYGCLRCCIWLLLPVTTVGLIPVVAHYRLRVCGYTFIYAVVAVPGCWLLHGYTRLVICGWFVTRLFTIPRTGYVISRLCILRLRTYRGSYHTPRLDVLRLRTFTRYICCCRLPAVYHVCPRVHVYVLPFAVYVTHIYVCSLPRLLVPAFDFTLLLRCDYVVADLAVVVVRSIPRLPVYVTRFGHTTYPIWFTVVAVVVVVAVTLLIVVVTLLRYARSRLLFYIAGCYVGLLFVVGCGALHLLPHVYWTLVDSVPRCCCCYVYVAVAGYVGCCWFPVWLVTLVVTCSCC